MGCHDYTCYVCDTPSSYVCRESDGGECTQSGIGEDKAMLRLLRFRRPGSPQSQEDFLERRGEAFGDEFRPFGYDWGEWEFQPSLNFRAVAMDRGGDESYFKINDVLEGPDVDELINDDDEGEVEIECSAGETIWAVCYCPDCYRRFVLLRDEPVCQLYLKRIAGKHELSPVPSSLAEARAAVKLL